ADGLPAAVTVWVDVAAYISLGGLGRLQVHVIPAAAMGVEMAAGFWLVDHHPSPAAAAGVEMAANIAPEDCGEVPEPAQEVRRSRGGEACCGCLGSRPGVGAPGNDEGGCDKEAGYFATKGRAAHRGSKKSAPPGSP